MPIASHHIVLLILHRLLYRRSNYTEISKINYTWEAQKSVFESFFMFTNFVHVFLLEDYFDLQSMY